MFTEYFSKDHFSSSPPQKKLDFSKWLSVINTKTLQRAVKFTYIKSLPHFSLGRKIMMPEKTGLFKIASCNKSPNKFCVICFEGEPSRRLKGSWLKGFFESILRGNVKQHFWDFGAFLSPEFDTSFKPVNTNMIMTASCSYPLKFYFVFFLSWGTYLKRRICFDASSTRKQS